MIQEESFTEESVRGLKTLNVFRDEESILRIKTKLTEKHDLRNFRYPILLPGKHRSFLLCLRRFIARRGRPKVIYSDNGTNFVDAENLLKKLDWDVIERETSIQRITWKFIPPSAPWWGAFWERIVQMAVINFRPLTYLSEDPNDLIPLTPSMFIQDISMVGMPDLDQLDTTDVKRRLKYRLNLRQYLRNRFRREYLVILLQPRKKSNYYEVKPGEIVLIEDDSKKRLMWPMAQILEVYPGKDKNVRVVRLKTPSSEIVRPVYPLEIKCTEDESPLNEKPLTTRRDRTVKVPSRFLRT
ncbi:uncharacterized protein LOC129962353 [Argiope bruennichi]|uniref:uncharacterized protein LOC129962353 n=1 Tax=Argiope bruennichi TaxID=94029 RepID=UPI0024943D71|nr:uncharacterized protein LOC129962353 [Argiope bruennichi]